MSDPAAFVLARLDEWEQAARTVLDHVEPGDYVMEVRASVDAMVEVPMYEPVRVLAQVAALRAVVELHDCDGGHECPAGGDAWDWVTVYERDCPTLLALAGIWDWHPDFDPAWKVET